MTSMNLLLLRVIDPDTMKIDDKVTSPSSGRKGRIAGITTDKKAIFVEFTNGDYGAWPYAMFLLTPLCWVEGKPVYAGDTLYSKESKNCYTVEGFSGGTACCKHLDLGAFYVIPGNLSWDKPKTAKTGWINLYRAGANSLVALASNVYNSEEDADESQSANRISCIQISWEE